VHVACCEPRRRRVCLCTFLGHVIVDQVVTVEVMRAVAAGDGVHGEPLPLSAQDYRGSRHGD
jgi:hypothetical protein